MIDVYPTSIEATDGDYNVLFTLQMEDAHCCTLQIKNPMLLSNKNLEEVLNAVRLGVNILGLKD